MASLNQLLEKAAENPNIRVILESRALNIKDALQKDDPLLWKAIGASLFMSARKDEVAQELLEERQNLDALRKAAKIENNKEIEEIRHMQRMYRDQLWSEEEEEIAAQKEAAVAPKQVDLNEYVQSLRDKMQELDNQIAANREEEEKLIQELARTIEKNNGLMDRALRSLEFGLVPVQAFVYLPKIYKNLQEDPANKSEAIERLTKDVGFDSARASSLVELLLQPQGKTLAGVCQQTLAEESQLGLSFDKLLHNRFQKELERQKALDELKQSWMKSRPSMKPGRVKAKDEEESYEAEASLFLSMRR